MNLVLNHPSSSSTLDTIIQFINELINCLKADTKSKKAKPIVKKETAKKETALAPLTSTCLKLRKERKALESIVTQFISEFNELSDKQQAEIEMQFFNAIKTMEAILPSAQAELAKNKFSYKHHFFNRELKKILHTFKVSQKKMADHLYPDNSQKLLSNPVEYQELVDFWGDLAD